MQARGAAAGFTLVELVTVIGMVGVLAAFAAPRFVGTTAFASRGLYDQAQGIVRYAQKIAIAQRAGNAPHPLIYVVVTASGISICYDAACAAPASDPSTGSPLAVSAPAGGAVTLAPVTTFSFDGGGMPSFGSQLEIQVSSSETGDVNRSFYVEATTGYVHP